MGRIKKLVKISRENGAKGGRPGKTKVEKIMDEKEKVAMEYDRLQEKLDALVQCRNCGGYVRLRYQGFHMGICIN